MENGVGVAEEIRALEVGVVDDGAPQLKTEESVVVVGAHGPRISEGDEVFEEAIESSLDDGNDVVDGSKPDLDDVRIDNNLSFSAAEENSGLGDEGETLSGVGEITDKAGEPLVASTDETFVANANHVTSEEISTVGESVLNHEPATPIEGLEVDPLTVEETDDDKDMVENSIVMRKSENSDAPVAENMGEDYVNAPVAENVEDITSYGDRILVDETPREVGDANVEEFEEALSGNLKDHGISELEAESASISLDHQENNGVTLEDSLVERNSEIQDGEKVNQLNLQLEPQHEGSNVEGSSPENSALPDVASDEEKDVKTESVISDSGPHTNSTDHLQSDMESHVEKDVKKESVTSDSGAHTNTTDELQTSDHAGKSLASEEGCAIEGRKIEEEKTTGRAINPAQTSNSSSGKSTISTLPPIHPAGLGRAAPLFGPLPRAANQLRANGQVSSAQTQLVEDPTNGEGEDGDEIRDKLQMIRVKFLRLAHRLGQTPHNVVVAQVLYRLGLAEQLRSSTGRRGGGGSFSFDQASAMARRLETTGQEPLDFSCTIMVLGKTGVGKSATINSIFDEVKFSTDAFQMGTKKVQDVVGTVQGIKVRVIDTPGLLSSCSDQRQNEKILHSVKRFINKSPPDIVLYLDRLDMASGNFGDMPLLRTITEIFGPSIWFNAIVVLTHAASAPPEGPNGTSSTYDMFVTQRSHAVQQAIRQAAGDMRLMNPVSLVENHSACRTNRAGQRVLPNGQVWKPHLLLLSFASKILAEANTLLKLQDTPPGKPFGSRSRPPPLPFLLSSLLQSRPQLKLPEEQLGGDDDVDDELDESSDSEDESEFDELPPFKPLTKSQLAKLSRAQKRAYYDELEYREKLFMKKQLKEEKKRRKMMKKMEASAKDMPNEYNEEESGGAASVPMQMPDLALPASFDSDNPTHRYRYLDTSNQWLVRPVLDTHGWDHDVGYEGINVERMFVVKDKIPLSLSGQVSKDKKEANVQMEVASSIKHGEGKGTTLGFDMQSVGKDMAYTLRSETRFSNYTRNKATAGLSATLVGDALSAGIKLEDKLIINKQLRMVMSGGAMAGRGDVAYGGSFEATFRDKDYPVGRFLSTLGLSVMDWHGELALGCNIQSQIPVGRFTNLVARANLNNRGSGQVSFRLNSSEQIQLALIGLIPLFRKLIGQNQEHPFGH